MLTTAEADALCDESFFSAFAWDRNAKGNLCRMYQGKLLTVYERNGWFGFCINAGRNRVTFGERMFRTEGEAMKELCESLERSLAGKMVSRSPASVSTLAEPHTKRGLSA